MELDAGRVAGPFDTLPLPNSRILPLSVREKDTPNEFCLLHNLSAPYDERSVNYNISQEDATVHYEGIKEAIQYMQKLGKGCFMAKSDIQSAFRLVPLPPSEWHLMGFMWKGKYYYDEFSPMRLLDDF